MENINITNVQGALMALNGLREACSNIYRCKEKIEKINNGTYVGDQEPITFNMQSSDELNKVIIELKDAMNALYTAAKGPDVKEEQINESQDTDGANTENDDTNEESQTAEIQTTDATAVSDTNNSEKEQTPETQNIENIIIGERTEPENTEADNVETDIKSNENEKPNKIKDAVSILCKYCEVESLNEDCDTCKVTELDNLHENRLKKTL